MSTARILVGDAAEMLRTLPDESVHCCVTSPPYWGLRDYGVAGQLGLEETPEEYVEKLVAVFREVRRVLRDDGTLWLVLGDSYAANRSYQVTDQKWRDVGNEKASAVPSGLKPKDLVGIPWRLAFALQADGWWLRSDIVWAKPNPMPESVTDRPTKAHEYVFLLSKSERYYYDAQAVSEPLSESTVRIHDSPNVQPRAADDGGWKSDHYGGGHSGLVNGPQSLGDGTRNRRSVWTINTRPYPDAHFAVFPPELVEPCIQAGTSEKGACVECGAPWERVVERPGSKGPSFDPLAITESGALPDGPGTHRNMGARYQKWLDENPKQTTGWQPTCDCDTDETVPCTVLDPFAGSGTTGMVATGHGRDAVLIDLNPEYVEMMKHRIGPMFVEAA